jgi:hypothetical protein
MTCDRPLKVDEIRKQFPTNYGRSHGMAWYRNKAMDQRKTWGNLPNVPMLAPGGGYFPGRRVHDARGKMKCQQDTGIGGLTRSRTRASFTSFCRSAARRR